MGITITPTVAGDTFTLDESGGLQTASTDDKGDDVQRTDILAAFERLLFGLESVDPDPNSLNLDSAFPDAGRFAKSAANFLTLTADDTITSITLAGFDNQADADPNNDTVVPLIAFDGTNFADGASTGGLQTLGGEEIRLFSDYLVDPDGGADFLAIAGSTDLAIQALAGNVVFGVDESGDIAFVILMEETPVPDSQTQVKLGFTMVSFQPLLHPGTDSPDDAVNLGDFLQLSVGQASGFSFEGTPPGKSNFLMAPAKSGEGGLLITSTSDVVEINTSNAGQSGTTIGWGSQGINAGETVLFTFVAGGLVDDFTIRPKGAPEQLDQVEADDANNIVFGALSGETGASFTIAQAVGRGPHALTITAYDQGAEESRAFDENSPPAGTFFAGLADDVGVSITSVTITRDGVSKTFADNGVTSFGVTVTFEMFDPDGDGSKSKFTIAKISGLGTGDAVAYTTDGEHHRVAITGVSGNFDVGDFAVESLSTATAPIGQHLFIEDDGPAGGGAEPFVVEEDHLANSQSTGISEDGEDGTFRDASGNAITDPATIDLGIALGINAGADTDAIFSLSSDQADLDALAAANDGLTSQSGTIKWHIEGDAGTGFTLIGFVDAENGTADTFDENTDREVIRWTLTSHGMATFTLLDQIDHPDEGANPTDPTDPADLPGENLKQVFLGAVLKVTDAERDPADLGENPIIYNIIDDVPERTQATLTLAVQEDALANFDPDHNTDGDEIEGSAGNLEDAADTTVAVITHEQLETLVSAGADAGLTFSLNDAVSGQAVKRADNSDLTSNGKTVYFLAVGGAVLGVTTADDTAPANADNIDRIVFSITADDKTFRFELIDQIDNLPAAAGEADTDSIDIGAAFLARDFDGDRLALGGAVKVAIENDVPTLAIDNLVGTGTANPQLGLWAPSIGADEPGTLSLTLDGYAIDGGDGMGSVVIGAPQVTNGTTTFSVTITDDFTGDAVDEDFVFDLIFRPDGTYQVDLAGGFGSSITVSSADGSLDAGGPDPVRTLTIPVPDQPPQSIVFFGVAPTTAKETIHTAVRDGSGHLDEGEVELLNPAFLSPADMNVSTAGIGLGNNNLNGNEFAGIDDLEGKKGFDESFVVNPESPLTMLKVFIDNSVGGYDPDTEQLYYTVFSEDGAVQGTADTLVTALTSEAGGQQSFLIMWDDSNVIDAVQLTMGSGTIKIPVINFTFAEASVVPPLQLDLTATLTDADGDSASASFSADLGADGDPLAEPDFRLAGTADEADVFNIDLAGAANRWVIEGGLEENDTLVLLDPNAGISLETGAGDDVITVGSKTVTVENGADVISGADILIEIGGMIVSGDFLTSGDSFVFTTPQDGPDDIAGFDPLTDQIVVSAAGFGGGLTAGALPTDAFHQGTEAAGAEDRFIYDTATGALHFDPDGTGAAVQQLVTTLDGAPALDETDILVIA